MGTISEYLTRVEARQAEATLQAKANHLDKFMQFLERRGLDVESVSSIDVEDWIDEQLNEGYADRTVQTRVYSISDFYEFLMARDVVASNPVKSVELGWLDDARINSETEVRYIEKSDYERMVGGELPIRSEIVIRLLWNTGVRASEAVNIKLDNIDREQRAIVVKNAKAKTETRTVWYSRRMARRLREYLDRGGRSEHLGSVNSPYLLVSRREQQMSPQRANIIVRDRADEVGIQEVVYTDADDRKRNLVTAHSLRHSYAVHRVRHGLDISMLSRLMGHSSTQTTEIYLQFSDEDLREADELYRP